MLLFVGGCSWCGAVVCCCNCSLFVVGCWLSLAPCSLRVVCWLRYGARVCLLVACARSVCYGLVLCCRSWIALLALLRFVVLLVEVCVVVRICGVLWWLVVVRSVQFVVRRRCALSVVVAVCCSWCLALRCCSLLIVVVCGCRCCLCTLFKVVVSCCLLLYVVWGVQCVVCCCAL